MASFLFPWNADLNDRLTRNADKVKQQRTGRWAIGINGKKKLYVSYKMFLEEHLILIPYHYIIQGISTLTPKEQHERTWRLPEI